jgi:branched-chain amino acid transport system substrate-binding protein
MSTTWKWIVGLVVVVLAVWGLSGLNKPKETGPIKIGSILPLTGDAASYGEPFGNILKLAVDQINQNGGIDGRTIELIIEDGRCNGKDATSAAQKLVNVEKVHIIIGGFCSGESLAALPVTSQAKVFLFSPGSSSPDLTGINKYFARNYPSDSSQGIVVAETASKNKKWKKVAVIQEATDYSVGLWKSFSEHFEELGGTVVREEFSPQSNDFRSQLTKLKGENPDAFFVIVQTPAAARRILVQTKEINWNVPIIMADAIIGDPSFISDFADRLEGAIGAEFGVDVTNLKFQNLLAVYKEKYGEEPPYQSYAQTIWDSAFIVADGLREVGNDGGAFADWIRELKNWQGASGLVTIGENGDLVGGHKSKIVIDGKVVNYNE